MKKIYLLLTFISVNFCNVYALCLTCDSLTTGDTINQGLIVCLPFENNAIDGAGFDNNAVVNGATLTTDRYGSTNNAYSFDGINDNLVCNLTTPVLATQYSYSAWVKYNSIPSGSFFSIVSIGGNTYDQALGFSPLTSPAGFRAISYYNTSVSYAAQSNVVPAIGTWYHLVATRDNTNLKLYVNGILEATVASPLPALYNTISNMTIGSRSDLTDFGANSLIDDVRMYNRVLSADEVNQLFTTAPCATGINDLNNNDLSFSIYPNPSNDFISIETIEDVVIDQIYMVSILGESTPLKFDNTNENKLDIHQFPAGSYTLNIRTKSGQLLSKKIQLIK